MKRIKDGGPAFPINNPRGEHIPGMTLRDYFAGHAMMGLLANPSLDIVDPEQTVADAYLHADAMLEERERNDY